MRALRKPATLQHVALAVTALVLSACASSMPRPVSEEALRQEIRARGLDPDKLVLPNRLTPAMRAWLAERVNRYGSPFETLRDLIYQLQNPSDLDLVYVPGFTGTAEEVFETGKFNCLSFTHLFVAMARELEIEAYYLEVLDVERYRRLDDLVVRSGHITAAYISGPERKVLEFDVGPEADYRKTEPMSDLEAVALYYANRGAELLRERRGKRALEMLEVAVTLAPELAEAWINLGVARRRMADLDGAQQAYERALEVDPDAFSAYLNLTTLYKLRGEEEAARDLLRLLDRRRNRNPFIYLALGDDSLREGRLDDAEHFYRKALSHSDEPAEARAALGLAALASGKRELAARWLDRAQRADPRNPRVTRLAEELQREADGG